jgi:hypothetical protein
MAHAVPAGHGDAAKGGFMKKTIVIALFALVFAGAALAQEAPKAPPAPGPEHLKLAGLVGSWTTSGEWVDSPFGLGGKWWGTIDSQWFPGQFAVVRRLEEKDSNGEESKSMDVITYDKEAAAYTWHSINSWGGIHFSKVDITGDALIMKTTARAKGKTYHIKGTLTGLGGDTLTYVQEYSEDGNAWKQVARSTDIRVKAK